MDLAIPTDAEVSLISSSRHSLHRGNAAKYCVAKRVQKSFYS